MENIKLEITPAQAGELLKAIALRIEYAKEDWQVERSLEEVGKAIERYAVETLGWKEAENALARIRYPIKRVTVTFYDQNPKVKP